MKRPHLDIEEKNDLVDLLVAFLDGYSIKDLDDIMHRTKVKLALAAAGEGVISNISGKDATKAA